MTRSSDRTETDFISVKPCGQKLYELVPKKKIRLDISSIATKLEKQGYRIIESSDLVLQIKGEHDVSIYPSGKMLVFPAENGDAAESVGRKIMSIIRARAEPTAEKNDS
ncbi:MAG: hypothetical protein QW505_04325 [Thermoplasmata archaeon]